MIPWIDSLVWNPSVNVGGKPILLDFCKCSVPQISCLSHMWMCSNIFRVRPTSFSLLSLPNMNVNKAYFLLFWVQKVCCVYIYLFLVAHNEVYSENWFRVHFYVNHDVKSSYCCLQSEYFALLPEQRKRGWRIRWCSVPLSEPQNSSLDAVQWRTIQPQTNNVGSSSMVSSFPCLRFKNGLKRYIFAQMGQCETSYT